MATATKSRVGNRKRQPSLTYLLVWAAREQIAKALAGLFGDIPFVGNVLSALVGDLGLSQWFENNLSALSFVLGTILGLFTFWKFSSKVEAQLFAPMDREVIAELPRVYRRVKHSKDEPYDEDTHYPAYPAELRELGVRLFRENRADYSSDTAAYRTIAPKLGCSPDNLRSWCQQAEHDAG